MTPMFKFSNIFDSMITNYVLANPEGWADIMDSYVKLYNFSEDMMICMDYFLLYIYL